VSSTSSPTIGPVYAKKLVRAFAEAVFEIIEQEPNCLREVTGIGPMRAARTEFIRSLLASRLIDLL
jgi:hypothetical protein